MSFDLLGTLSSVLNYDVYCSFMASTTAVIASSYNGGTGTTSDLPHTLVATGTFHRLGVHRDLAKSWEFQHTMSSPYNRLISCEDCKMVAEAKTF